MTKPIVPETKKGRTLSEIYLDSEDGQEVYKMAFDTNGFWHCEGHSNKVWCEDIQRMIQTSQDVQPIWNLLASKEQDSYFIQVPMVMRANLFQKVEVVPLGINSKSPNAGELNVVADDDGSPLWENRDLGILSIGEGIKVMRSMIRVAADQALAEIKKKHFECKSNQHGYAQEIAWTSSMETGLEGEKFQQRYCVLVTGRCIACHSTASFDPSAYVPDDEYRK